MDNLFFPCELLDFIDKIKETNSLCDTTKKQVNTFLDTTWSRAFAEAQIQRRICYSYGETNTTFGTTSFQYQRSTKSFSFWRREDMQTLFAKISTGELCGKKKLPKTLGKWCYESKDSRTEGLKPKEKSLDRYDWGFVFDQYSPADCHQTRTGSPQQPFDQFHGVVPCALYKCNAIAVLPSRVYISKPRRFASAPFQYSLIWYLPMSLGLIFPRWIDPSFSNCVFLLSHQEIFLRITGIVGSAGASASATATTGIVISGSVSSFRIVGHWRNSMSVASAVCRYMVRIIFCTNTEQEREKFLSPIWTYSVFRLKKNP